MYICKLVLFFLPFSPFIFRGKAIKARRSKGNERRFLRHGKSDNSALPGRNSSMFPKS